MSTFEFIKRYRQSGVDGQSFSRSSSHPAVASHGSAAVAVRTLRTLTSPTNVEKAVLTDALLLGIRAGDTGLAGVLLEGYLPMLEFILAFERGLVDDDALRESMVLEAFFESVAAYRRGPSQPCLYLHRETRRRYLLAARRFHRERSRLDLVSMRELDRNHHRWWEGKPARTEGLGLRAGMAECAQEVCELLRALVGSEVPKRKLALVEATLLRGEDLAAYVERRYPRQSRHARLRTYGRLQRQRNRTLHKLRGLLRPWRAEVMVEGS